MLYIKIFLNDHYFFFTEVDKRVYLYHISYFEKNTHIKICYKIYHIKYTIEKYVIWTIRLRWKS